MCHNLLPQYEFTCHQPSISLQSNTCINTIKFYKRLLGRTGHIHPHISFTSGICSRAIPNTGTHAGIGTRADKQCYIALGISKALSPDLSIVLKVLDCPMHFIGNKHLFFCPLISMCSSPEPVYTLN